MKNLLIKEFKLGINVQIVIFVVLSLLILVPSWPAAASLLYSISGIITLFPRALANKDIEYTVLLPIKKTDVVKGKTIFIMAIEVIIVILSTIGGIIRVLNYLPAKGEEAYFEAVKPCVSHIGLAFIGFGVMNLIMIAMYYKDPYKKLTAPLLISSFGLMIILALGSLLIAFIPELRIYNEVSIIYQTIIVIIGFLLFVLLSYIGYKIGAKRFSKIDL